ncbi:cell division protein FtsZ [Dictyobacter aurantiacus]|nr:cell division protein FtsZ [Dictyobacter aurantiacus]
MQPMSDDAYKRNMASEPWRDQARQAPDVYEGQENQWAILRHEVAENVPGAPDPARGGWDQRYTDGDPLSPQSPLDFEASAEAPHNVDIVVVGVGGGGMNAVNRMIHTHVRGVRFVAMNTDAQVLALCEAPHRICLGQNHTKGLGAGGNAAVGMRAATESSAEIREALGNADLVFIAAGMGGGTGTGAAPVVASIARQMGALTVGIVTLPFTFEGSRRKRIAEQGLAELSAEIDALITIPNDRLLNTVARDRNLADAFKVADDVLRQGVQGIAEVINVPGMINVDFADVRSVLREAGTALMSIGQGSGRNRAQVAAEEAVAGGFLNVTIRGAKRVLFNISGGEDMTLFEVNEVAEHIGAAIDDAADIIFGAVVDPTLNDTIRVTLIAAGMEELRGTRGHGLLHGHQVSAARVPPSGMPLANRPTTAPTYPDQGSGRPWQTAGMPGFPGATPPVQPPEPPVAPPPTRMPPALHPTNPPQPGRQQRSLNDLRGIRGMGNRQEGGPRYRPTVDQDGAIEPPPFIKRNEK